MKDVHLSQLVRALDAAVESSPGDVCGKLHGGLEQAALRLRCLNNRLGDVVVESPYLAFLRRTTRLPQSTAIALSA